MGRRSSITLSTPNDPAARPYKSAEYFSKTEPKRRKWKAAKQILSDPSAAPFHHHSAPPSLLPRRHYCDVTGLRADYCDRKSGLRYHSSSVYQHIKGLSPNSIQSLLAIRNANTEI